MEEEASLDSCLYPLFIDVFLKFVGLLLAPMSDFRLFFCYFTGLGGFLLVEWQLCIMHFSGFDKCVSVEYSI